MKRESLLLTLCLGSAVLLSATAHAEVPYLLPVVGVISDADDAPLEGAHSVTFRLYDGQGSGATTLWTEQVAALEFDGGLFRAYLGADTTLDIADFVDRDGVWLGIQIGVDQEMTRVRLAAVPWALEAEVCGELADLSAAGVQPAIGAAACGGNTFMQGWDGASAVCAEPLPGANVLLVGDIGVTVQAEIDQTAACSHGIVRIYDNGAVECAQYYEEREACGAAGDRYLGSDQKCHTSTHSCAADHYVINNGNTADDDKNVCAPSPQSCNPNQYLDGDGACRTIAGTANALAMFTGAAAPGAPLDESVISQSGSIVSVGGDVSVTGTTTTGDLAVTGTATTKTLVVNDGLPITLSNEYHTYAGDGTSSDPVSVFMAPVGNSMCFLTRVRIHDSEVNNDEGTCFINQALDGATTKWRLNATRLGNVDTGCSARCISW